VDDDQPEESMTFPSIHLNGTAAEDLLADYIDACQDLRTAIQTVQKTGPNARDYYVQGPGAFASAQEEHISRLQRLEGVLGELEALTEAVSKEVK
jgi:hypothetical protein